MDTDIDSTVPDPENSQALPEMSDNDEGTATVEDQLAEGTSESVDLSEQEFQGSDATPEVEDDAPENTDDLPHGEENEDEDEDPDEELDVAVGEWSLCSSMVFLAVYLVMGMGAMFATSFPDFSDLASFEFAEYRDSFPVGIATMLLLISVLSGFCSYISLLADSSNRRTWLIRIITLGPILPTLVTAFMIWVIVHKGSGKSILENFLG